MKKIITTALALVLTLGMSVTAFASPSPSEGVVVDKVTVNGQEVAPQVNALPTETVTAAAAKATELVSSDSQVLKAVEVTLPEGVTVSKENPVTLSFTLSAVEAGTNVVALHQLSDGTWEVLPCTWKDGKVQVTFTSLSPVVFVSKPVVTASNDGNYSPEYYESLKTVNGNTTAAATGVTSPKTADAGVFGFALAAVICGAGLVCVNRKKAA